MFYHPIVPGACAPAPPETHHAILRASATELAARIARGELDSSHVVEVHIAQIQRTHASINALVRARFDQARREAERADIQRAERPERLGPLHGVPCTIKESFAVRGMPHTAGLVSRRGRLATEDAVTVARARRAGAIPMGVTNTPELCMWYETHNHVYGRTHNAYSGHHICGGSSGGEGAIVGAGASPWGLGSDVGGSIRMPAYFNGVFGHKSSAGCVPSSGQFPTPHGVAAKRYLCTGPLCRRAEDLYPLMQILSGEDGEDPSCVEREAIDPSTCSIEAIERVYVVETNHISAPSEPVRTALERAERALVARGVRVERIELRTLRHSFDVWAAMMDASDGPGFADLLGGERGRPAIAREMARALRHASAHTWPALVLCAIEAVVGSMERRAARAIAQGARLGDEIRDLLGARSVVMCPTFPTLAPRHRAPLTRPRDFAYTAIFNVLELPATQIPTGLDAASGLPTGVQIVAPGGSDHLGLLAARVLERELGGWVPPWQTVTS